MSLTHHQHLLPAGTVHYWLTHPTTVKGWLVFTHGALMEHRMFEPQWDYFTARGYRVLVWDVPGHGQSRPWTNFNLDQAAEALLAILDQEQCSAAHFVGQSMGSFVAQLVEQKQPQRVLSLTSLESTPLDHDYSWLDRFLLKITPPLLRLYPYSMLVNTIAKATAQQPQVQAFARKTLQQYTKEELVHIMHQVYAVVGNPAYRPLKCPLCLIIGATNKVGKTGAYSKAWADRTQAPLIVVPDAGHNANQDNPDFYNQAQYDFLESVG